MLPTCSIIIRAFNEERHIGRLLTGIRQQDAIEPEVILVDSGSTDATIAIARAFDAEIVSIQPSEFTFGRALNLGCQRASGEVLVLASAHVYPIYTDWLEQLLRPFADSSVALSYGRQVGGEPTKYSEHRIFAKWFPGQSDLHQDHPFCNNANAAVRTSVWQDYRYDESLTGLEDLDLAKRVCRDGWRIAYIAEAPIVHIHEETPSRVFNRYRREAIALRRIMPEVHMSLWEFMRLFAGNTMSDYWHAWLERKLLPNLADIPVFRLMQFWGAYRGFHQRGPVGSTLRQRFYYPHSMSWPAADSQSVSISQEPVDYSSSAQHLADLSASKYPGVATS